MVRVESMVRFLKSFRKSKILFENNFLKNNFTEDLWVLKLRPTHNLQYRIMNKLPKASLLLIFFLNVLKAKLHIIL